MLNFAVFLRDLKTSKTLKMTSLTTLTHVLTPNPSLEKVLAILAKYSKIRKQGGMLNFAVFLRDLKTSKTLKNDKFDDLDTRFCCFESLKIKDTLVNFCFSRFSEICSMLGRMQKLTVFLRDLKTSKK